MREGDGPWGREERHLARQELDRIFAKLPPPPADRGSIVLLVSRVGGGARTTPERFVLTREGGMPDDAWGRGRRRPETQLAVMRADVAAMIANGQPLTLFGDNLLVDLDLSSANLPHGTRLRVGEALLEVTPEPHDGCLKFRQRFGADALRMTADRQLRPRHLRGIYMRVIEDGPVAVGDPVVVTERPVTGGAP